MIGFLLNLGGGLLNLALYVIFKNEVNLLCAKISFFFSFFFLVLYLFSVPLLVT